jgi:putative hydrolase of the HAD superfamily
VALHEYFDTKGLADRLEEFVSYWFEKDADIDRGVLAQADAWRRRTGGRVYAATNQEHHRIAYLRDRLGLGAHFDEIVYSAALGVCKPERVFYTNAQARMGVTVAQSILFVDDKTSNVDGARMAGWRAMLYRGPESLERALAGWG